MATPALGIRGKIQMGKESTFGTKVAATKAIPFFNCDIQPVIGVIEDETLNGLAARSNLFQGGLYYKGRFEIPVLYEGLSRLLEWAFGLNTLTGPTDSAYTQTCKPQVALPSASIEVVEGDPGQLSQCAVYLGAKCLSMRISGKAALGNEGWLRAECEVIAKDKQTAQTPTGLSLPTIWPVLFHKGLTVLEGSGDSASNIRVNEFELELVNKMLEERFYVTNSNLIDEPLREGFVEANWKMVQEFATMALHGKATAFTNGVMQLIFQDPTLIGSSSKREFELRSNKANVERFGAPVQAYGVVRQTVGWKTKHDATDVASLVCRVQNSESAL